MTIDDVKTLREEFLAFAETAETHMFPLIMLIHNRLDHSIENFETMSQEEQKAMFRVVYKIMGKNVLNYK